MEYILIFLAGLMGSFHCIGMCGAFPVSLSSVRKTSAASKYISQLLYNSGRVITYVSLGSLFGVFGYVAGESNFLVNGQIIVSVVAGLLMILVGLQIAGFLREQTVPGFGYVYRFVSKGMKHFIRKGGVQGGFFLGLFNGFLPCPLVYAFLFTSASTASPVKGAAVMGMLGLGTIPAMLLLGLVSEYFSPVLRARISRYVPGAIIILFGFVTLFRAFIPVFPDTTHLMHH